MLLCCVGVGFVVLCLLSLGFGLGWLGCCFWGYVIVWLYLGLCFVCFVFVWVFEFDLDIGWMFVVLLWCLFTFGFVMIITWVLGCFGCFGLGFSLVCLVLVVLVCCLWCLGGYWFGWLLVVCCGWGF